MDYCVYITIYKGNKLPPFYIGYTRTSNIYNGYRGSVSSKSFKKIWKKELKENSELFNTKILKHFQTSYQALEYEEYLHRYFKVHKNELYINQSISNKTFRNNVKNFKHTEQTKLKISAAQKGIPKSKDIIDRLKESLKKSLKHKQASLANRQKATLANIGSKRSKETKAKISAANKGKKISAEVRLKMSLARKGKKFGKRPPYKQMTCPYCHKTSIVSNIKRWHLDNCKARIVEK